jgi:hypothetical protein
MAVSLINIAGILVVVLTFILMIIFLLVNRKTPWRGLRTIPAFSKLRQAIFLAVEDGSRLHVSLGKASVNSQVNASGLVGLSMLERIAQLSSISDRPPIATSGDGSFSVLSQDTLRGAYRASNASDLYNADRGRLAGPTPLSYVAGTLPVIWDENVSTNVLIGNFGPEVALLADAANKERSYLLAASDALPAQAVLYATASEPLIGEDLFAGGTYLQTNPSHPASLHAQDVMRWLLVGAMLVGAALKLARII